MSVETDVQFYLKPTYVFNLSPYKYMFFFYLEGFSLRHVYMYVCLH